jgi:hypothetical protein
LRGYRNSVVRDPSRLLLLLAFLLAETLTGIYVANDVANEGPDTAQASSGCSESVSLPAVIVAIAIVPSLQLHLFGNWENTSVGRQPPTKMGFALPTVLELRRYGRHDLHNPEALLL